jgi:hypothetical protein
VFIFLFVIDFVVPSMLLFTNNLSQSLGLFGSLTSLKAQTNPTLYPMSIWNRFRSLIYPLILKLNPATLILWIYMALMASEKGNLRITNTQLCQN